MIKKNSSKIMLMRISAALCAFSIAAAIPCGNFYRPILSDAAESDELEERPFPFLSYHIYQNWNDSYSVVIEKCDTDYIGNLVIPEYIEGVKVTKILSNAFEGCLNLTGIDIPETVEEIGSHAFTDCFSLRTVIIRNEWCMISNSDDVFNSDWRYGNDKFTGTIYSTPESTSFEYAQRYGLNFSTDIPELKVSPPSVLPYLTYEVDRSAVIIKKCDTSAYGKFMIPKYIEDMPVMEISEGAFKGCSGIKEIEIPDTIMFIAPETFADCSGLRKIDLPESVRFIEQNAFSDCSSLETVIVRNIECDISNYPETICNTSTPIGYSQDYFFGTIYAPAGSKAEEYANHFHYNFSTEIPKDQIFAENALPYLSYEEMDHENGIRITKCSPDASGNLIIPYTIDGKYVSSIAEEAFMDCKKITEIEIPPSVIAIESSAFFGCTELKKIDLGREIFMIEPMAFAECSSLKTVIIRSADCHINQIFETFGGYDSSFTGTIYGVADSTAQEYAENNDFNFSTEIPDCTHYAVDDTSYLTFESGEYGAILTKCDPSAIGKLIIPKLVNGQLVERISENAFEGCLNLTSVVIPDSVGMLQGHMFDGCESLCEIILPEYINEIPNYTFSRCMNLKKIELPDNLIFIGDNAFDHCSSLEKITIPEQVSTIMNSTFLGCESLKTIELPENLTTISVGAFSECTSLESIELPKNLKTLDYAAFSYCKNLKTVEIPSGLDKIEGAVFERSGITSIVIPENILTISSFSFNGCENLEKITILNPYCDIYDSSQTICSSRYYSKDDNTFNGVICGYDDSTAEKYAEKYGYSFESLGEAPEGVRGDANADGKLTVADAVMLEKWLLGCGKLTASKNVDLCKDERIDVYDMCLLRKELVAVSEK